MGKLLRKAISWIITVVMVIGLMNGLVFVKEVKAASAPYGIMGNGTGGINININASPYTDFQRLPWGHNAYGMAGCAWFASARVKQLTGKGNTICGSYNWYNWYGKSLGFSTGSELRAPAILCWGGNSYNGDGHVAILEKIVGNTAYISEGGYWKDANHGYTIIRTCSLSQVKTCYSGPSSNPYLPLPFIGCVYLGDKPKPTPPQAPTNIRIDKTDIGLGDGITVSWNASSGATAYNVNLVCTTNSANNQSKSVGGTSTSFSINKAGTYKISVSAKNSAGTSGASTSGNFVAHNNVTVKYEDWDGSVLKTQSVKYGGNATAPVAPSREGYTFQTWSSDGKNVKSDITIKAEYKINTYSVSFVDYKGDIIGNVQKVEHGSSAVVPKDIPTKEGYVFSEWSTKEYEKVTKSLTVKAVYVWGNTNLPIITKIVSAKRNDEATGYDIEVKVSNFPNDFTKGKLVATLKTKNGKMLASEIKSISMPTEGEVDEKFTILYSGLAPRVDVSMIGVSDDNTTGTPKSKIVTAAVDIGNKWSDWSATVPEGEDIITESRTEYRYKDTKVIKSTTQPATPTGYSLISREATGTYSAWGNWSGWSDTAVSGNTLRNVETKSVVASYKTQYNYSRWASKSNNTGNLGPCKGTWGGVYCGYYFERGWTDSPLTVSGTQYSNQVGGYFNLYGGNQWFNQNTRSVAASYKTQYRYQTRNEYYNYKYKQNEFTEWQTDTVLGTDTREVENRTTYRFKTNSTEVPCYNYKRYKYTNINNGKIVYSYTSAYADSMEYPGEWEYKTAFTQLEKVSTVDDDIELYNGTGENSWYKANVNSEGAVVDFETTSSLEDQTGVPRTLEGKAEGAAGKVATLMIYKGKNDDPIASQIEYIGQTVIGEDGTYKFDYITKEEPSALTGDFVITLGIEGATNYVNIGKIEAPKKVYIVDFVDDEGEIIGEHRSVVEGGTVEAPTPPEKDGYEFIGWDTGLRNIQENTVVTAQYRKKKCTVIFIDWDETNVGIREFEYGDQLESPESVLEREGQKFDKWVDENDNEITTVTQNMIVTAQYKDTKYKVTFLDWNGEILSEQEVGYGEEANIPENLSAPDEYSVFSNWDSQGEELYITRDMTISPVSRHIKTSSNPIITTKPGTNTDTQEVGMYSLASNTDIYYYVVDVKSAEDDVLYLGEEVFTQYEEPFNITEDCIVYAYAKTNNMNASDIVSSVITINGEKSTTENQITQEVTPSSEEISETTEQDIMTETDISTTIESTTKEIIPTKPTGLQGIVDKNDNYNLFWTQSKNAVYYNVYVNNELVGNTVSANYRIPASVFLDSGEYVVEVEAVNDSSVSDKASIIYKVELETSLNDSVTTSDSVETSTETEKVVETISENIVTTNNTVTSESVTEEISIEITDTETMTTVETTTSMKESTTDKNVVTKNDPTTKRVIVNIQKNAPKKSVIKRLKNKKKKKLYVQWKWQVEADGYQVQYALNKKFTKKVKTKNINSFLKESTTIKKLKKKKKYYVRVRAYKKFNGKKVYGAWSNVKKVKIKK